MSQSDPEGLRGAKAFMIGVSAAGVLAAGVSLLDLSLSQLDARFYLLAAVTIVIGSRITVKLPRLRSQISLSDVFLFIALMLFPAGAVVLLAAAEAFYSSTRFARQPLTRVFNAAAMACSTLAAISCVRFAFGPMPELARGPYGSTLVAATLCLGLVHYLVNTILVGLALARRESRPFWPLWTTYYLWTGVTSLAAASSALIIVHLIEQFGFYAFMAIVPVVSVIHFAYATYVKNLETSQVQVEQTQRHLRELQISEERFRSAFDNAAIGMALVSHSGEPLEVNPALCRLIGFTESEVLARTFPSLTHPEDRSALVSAMHDIIQGRLVSHQMEARLEHRMGHEVWVVLSISRIRDPLSEAGQLTFQLQDITDRMRAEKRLHHDAFHDALTGLPNRALFTDHLKMALARSKRDRTRSFAVLFMDLDRFKIINDSLGHMVGDQFLVGIARRLETCLRAGDTIARLGGDEFTILLEEVRDVREAIHVAERVREKLTLPFNLNGQEVVTTISIGIAPSAGYERPEDILRDADTAMYRAKSLGKSRHEIFDPAMHTRAKNLLQLETDLRKALERSELLVHYQPIVYLETGRIAGFEALVRWKHPEQGFVSPLEFIPVAEDSGLIQPIGEWVLREACRQLHAWKERFPAYSELTISVNVSGKQFSQTDLIEMIQQTLDENRLEARNLKLEITESTVVENVETAITMLKQLKSRGVESCIDDFGTGYSSLSYLHRFSASTLKVDRSFISRMTEQAENVEIVRSIVMLARNLEMNVVAEGIETEEQLVKLRALSCEQGQGYFFSRPLDSTAATMLLESSRVFALTKASSPALETA